MNIRDALKTETAMTMRCEEDAQAGIDRDELEAMARKAETGEQWAEICRLEALTKWLPCPRCGEIKKDFVCGICCDCLGV